MDTRQPPPETIDETAAASDAVLWRLQKLLTASQAMIFATRQRVKDSRALITDVNMLRIPAGHPVQSREGFLPAEMAVAA